MDRVHFCSGSAPLCRAPGALWCTILRDAVTCPACLVALAERESSRARGARAESSSLAPASKLMP
jgi:hypothetical protein